MKRLLLGLTIACFSFLINLGLVAWVSQPYRDLKARELLLKQELRIIRRTIDEYAIDKKELPKSLSDLVNNAYLSEIPNDSITLRKDWIVEKGEDTVSSSGGVGVVDVRSNAEGKGTDGKSYIDY